MKVKKLLLATTVALLSLSASAANPEDVRIYINPGHGSYTGSDRPMSTIKHGNQTSTNVGTDTAGFFESNTNLQKGFGLLEKLKEYGIPYNSSIQANNAKQTNLRMSHVKCGTSRNLSDIAAEAESWNADYFISIHSNATTGDHNVPTHYNHCLYLYRGYDGNPKVSGSDKMATASWPHALSNKHMNWNWLSEPTKPRDVNKNDYVQGQNYYPIGKYDADGNPYWIKGDLDFMYEADLKDGVVSTYGYYGVLAHNVPGFLVEGYDHTYQPAMHRAMNDDVCRHEGEMYARGINDYFGWGKKDSYGKIYGVVRDHSVVMDHPFYQVTMSTTIDANKTINQIDNKKPLNHVTVELYNSSGALVDSYLTDDEWNGAYMFKKVAPGSYTIKHSRVGYGEVTQSVTVTANQTNYLNIDMRTVADGTAVQGHYAYGLKLTKVDDATYTASFKSTGAMSNGKIILTNSSTKEQTIIETGSIKKGDNSITIDAKKLDADINYTWAVAFDNPESKGYKQIFNNTSVASSSTRVGVAIDNEETSANFGTIYTITGSKLGVQKFNPDFSVNGSKFMANYFNYPRIETNSGKLYVVNNDGTNPGVWVYNPSGSTTPTQVLSTQACGVAFSGTGSSRKMYLSGKKFAYGYNIGTADSWSGGASTTFSALGTLLVNGDGDIYATDNAIIASQIRYSPNNVIDVPSFAVSDLSRNIKFNSKELNTEATDGSSLEGSNGGGFAFSKDKSIFAIQDGSSDNTKYEAPVKIYSVKWNGSTPTFIYHYTITLSGTYAVDQIAFDHADNLYIASRQKGLLVYAIKTPARQTVTNGSGTIVGAKPPTPLYIVGNSAAIGSWDPAKAVEFTNTGKNYTITLNETVTEFKISTGKGEISGDWTAFDAGNLTTNDAITNGGTINLIAQHSYSNFVLPWAGVWNITVSGDLSTLTATTTTPKPLPPLYIVGNTAELGAWNTENAVEVANDGTKYTVTLNENVTAFKISTNKGDATTFNNGNLSPGGAITNGGTLNLIADKDGGNIALPWEGVWNVTIAGDLSTLHASTSTPNPDEGPGIGAEPEDAPNPDAEPTETDEAEDAQTEGYFAYDLQSSKSGDVYTFKFKSTGARKNGRIVLTNKSTGAKTEIKTPIVKGQNTVTINAYDIVKGDYTWAVKLTNNANSTVTQVASDNSIIYNNGSINARIGVAIDRDETSANFGTIYTMTAMGQGLQKYNADFSKNGSKILTGMFGQDVSSSTSTNKYKRTNRLEVNGGKVYIANYANSTYKGIWVYNPSGSATATSVESSPLYERGIGFYGTGSSRKAFVTTDGSLRRYDIGTSSSWAQSGYAANYAGVMVNGDGDVITTANAIIVSQHRFKGLNDASVPAFAVFDHNLNLITTSATIKSSLNGSQCGGMALSPDNKTFAIVDAYPDGSPADISVQVYNLTWSGSSPTFTHQYSIPLSGTQQVDQMEFDHAGNLYIASREKGLLKYAVKTSARATVTNSTATITGLGRDVAPSNVVAIRQCYGEGSNTAAGTVDAKITWTGEAGEYKVYYQTMRRDASGNRVEDNSTWVEAGTATIASGSTSGTFIHKNLAHGGDYDRIYNYKVANYYPAANYASELKSKAITGKGRTITSAAPHNPVNVTLSQPTEVKDGVTLYSFDVKLDLAPNTDVFNASLRDDNDELPTITKYVIVVDEATAKVLNAASNVSEVGRFYKGPATMTANNCNHYVINDWYMVVDIDDVTPSDDLSKANKSLTWKNVNPLHSFKPQVYASAVRTFNFTATDASILGNPDADALTMTLPSPQWISTQDDGSVGVVTLEGDYSSLVTTDDYPMGTFRKVGDIENPTNPVTITRANYIGSLGAMLQPLAVTDDIMGTRNANGVYENATWNIAYTFKLYEKSGEEWTLIREIQKYDQQSPDANVNSLYSNTSGLSFDITGMSVGADEVAAPDGRKRLVYNPQKNKEYKLVVETNYRRYINGEQVHAVGVSENLITINPTFAAPSIIAAKSPGFLFMETATHWDENCTTNNGYYKYYYDAAVDVAWNAFNDNLARYMGFHATPKFNCAGHYEDKTSTEWTPYYAASVLTDSQVESYNIRKATSSGDVLTKLGYSGKEDWSTMATEENHIPLKVHYVWAGNDKIADTGDAEFGFELSANYPIVSVGTPEFKINQYPQSGAYEFALVNPLSRSTSGYELQMITSVNKEYKTLVMDGIIETPTTGVENVGTGNGALRLYPNPANSVVTLQAPITITDVKIFTVDGQLMKEFDADDTKVKINVSDLPTGVYIVHAAGSTTRLIKR